MTENATSDGLRLTEWTTCGGCAAKWGAGLLRGLIDRLADSATAGLLVGLAPFDDAAVLRLTDDLALVSTTDFFPPLVDDPADFGAIAAANACSDVFAMGGEVRLALNVAAFPENLPIGAIETILRSAAEVVREAGGTIAGGHTIRNEEPIFGLAVQGIVHPDRVWTKGGAGPGDVLVLSKPLGTGLVLAGGTEAEKAVAIRWMRTLNQGAADQLRAIAGGPHACTDVTLPIHAGALAAAEAGIRTGGDARNRAALEGQVHIASSVHPAREAIGFDPQTSGGLLAAVAPGDAAALVDQGWSAVGHVEVGAAHVIVR